ncbi:hypothetical protein IGS68_08635 [Skermanella sp. TT6]|uniref:Uracil DNA glycosylase superfamily protein n=1 Tax=Skermanella cutis TaxID=2775420 RepID=A0ABX7BA64_9PROT|nr:hypothetical protein [Skermanella sp. TT6]QQP91256.1 hypothetical protein IGS68_08635 [Skermanella sp. TT6]
MSHTLEARATATPAVIPGDPPASGGTSAPVAAFREIVAAHGERTRGLRDTVSSLFVENRDLSDYAADGGPLPDLVLVGDNPGRREWENSVYLCAAGRAGRMAHAFFDGIYGPGSFRSKVMVLNKSSYHTPRTAGLTQTLRDGVVDSAVDRAIRHDQEENARLIAGIVALLGIPVVTIGMESGGATFRDFRRTLESRYRSLGEPPARFQGRSLPSPFRKVPHFSLSKIFCRNSDPRWNASLDRFLGAWEGRTPGLRTGNGNVSSKILLESRDRAMLSDYLSTVIMEAGDKVDFGFPPKMG